MLDKQELIERAKKICMIALDVDGVMTDGKVYFHTSGIISKAFNIRDGFGVVMARYAGLEFAIITGQKSEIVEHRAAQLGIKEVHQGFVDKSDVMRDILKRNHLDSREVAFMGDDLFDLPVIRMVGLSASPADADEVVKSEVHWISSKVGGNGAVRDFIEMIVKAKGLWEKTLSEFVKS